MSHFSTKKVTAASMGSVLTLTGNSGGAVSPDGAGNIDVLGGTTGLVFNGSANTVTLAGTLIVGNGGTGATSLTDGGIVLGSGTAAVTVTSQPTDGQLLIGSTGADPVLGTLASADGSVTFATGAGTLDLSVDAAASGAIDGIIPDTGTSPVVPDGSGDVTFTGGNLITTTGGTNEVTFDLDDGTDGQLIIGSTAGSSAYATLASADSSVTISNGSNSIDLSVDAAASGAVVDFLPDSGTTPVVPDGTGSVTITGGTTGLTFVGGTNSLTQSGTLVVANGGTGATSLTGVLTGNGTSAITANTVTQHAVILGGASNAVNEVSGLGTSGFVLTSNGAGSDPTWQATAMPDLAITSLDDTDSTYTVLSADQLLSCDVSSGVLAIDLPNTTDTGRRIWIKDNSGNAAAQNITLSTPGGTVTIDGVTSYTIDSDFQSVTVVFDGTNYLII